MTIQRSILVIDGAPAVTAFLECALRHDGHRVMAVNNTADAVRAFKRAQFDLVLVDPLVPSLRGFDLRRLLLKHRKRMAVVLMTTNESSTPVQDVLGLPVAICLAKPFTLEELQEVISLAASRIEELAKPTGRPLSQIRSLT
jgi:DNA-binding response OmpR family regulator